MKNVTKSGCGLPLTDKGQLGKKVYIYKKNYVPVPERVQTIHLLKSG